MSEYPPEIVEKMAAAMAVFAGYDGCFERIAAFKAASDEERELGDIEEPTAEDYEDADWWRKRAIAGLDALGLQVKHQWQATWTGAEGGQNAVAVATMESARVLSAPNGHARHRVFMWAETPWGDWVEGATD